MRVRYRATPEGRRDQELRDEKETQLGYEGIEHSEVGPAYLRGSNRNYWLGDNFIFGPRSSFVTEDWWPPQLRQP